MKFSELILQRQSVRRYSNKIVDKHSIEQCLEAARMAPSASNSQPWRFIVVNQEPIRRQLAEATFSDVQLINKFVLQAPVIVVIVLEKPKLITRLAMAVKKKEWCLIDIGIAAEHFCLQAAELGLGTCMVGWFNEKRIKNLIQIPSNKEVALLITLGYPADEYPQRTKIRKPMAEIVAYEKY